MGYSDLGCYGGEIETQRLDSLTKNGLRFTHAPHFPLHALPEAIAKYRVNETREIRPRRDIHRGMSGNARACLGEAQRRRERIPTEIGKARLGVASLKRRVIRGIA
jgi:hypothetical protein